MIFVRRMFGQKDGTVSLVEHSARFWQLWRVHLNIQPKLGPTWLISIYNHRVLERASGAMFLNEKPPMSMIQGKCACLRAKSVEISGHSPSTRPAFARVARDGGREAPDATRGTRCPEGGFAAGRWPDTLSFWPTLYRLSPGDEDIEVHFEDGTSAQAEYLIACDGVSSALRKPLSGDEKRYLGLTSIVCVAPLLVQHPLVQGGYFMALGDDGSSAFCYRQSDSVALSYTVHAPSEDDLNAQTQPSWYAGSSRPPAPGTRRFHSWSPPLMRPPSSCVATMIETRSRGSARADSG